MNGALTREMLDDLFRSVMDEEYLPPVPRVFACMTCLRRSPMYFWRRGDPLTQWHCPVCGARFDSDHGWDTPVEVPNG